KQANNYLRTITLLTYKYSLHVALPIFVANQGDLFTLGISYHLPVNAPPLDSITFYNNYGYYNKKVTDYESSHMNVLGGMLTAGRSEEHTSELQSRENLVCRLLIEQKYI